MHLQNQSRRPRSRAAATLLLILGTLLLSAGGAAAQDFSLHGSYKSNVLGIHDIGHQNELYGLAGSSLRLDAALNLGRPLSLEISYVLGPQVSTTDLLQSSSPGLTGGPSSYRAFDLPNRLIPRADSDLQNLGLYQNLDRLLATLYLPFGDLLAGRQAISWGSARVVHPTDIIAPYHFGSIDTEEKPGVDALRLRIPLGMLNELDLGYVAGEDFAPSKSALFARGKFYLFQTDLSLLAMAFKEHLLAGLDLTRSLGGAGSWLEAAWVLPGTFSAGGPELGRQYLTATAGLDYNFSGTLYGYAEYHYNGAGATKAAEYPTPAERALIPGDYPAYTDGSIYLLGRHYLNIGGTYQLSPLLSLSGITMINLQDPSLKLSLGYEYNFKEGLYLTGGAYLGFGKQPRSSGSQITEYRSEFGAAPWIFYSGMKIYF